MSMLIKALITYDCECCPIDFKVTAKPPSYFEKGKVNNFLRFFFINPKCFLNHSCMEHLKDASALRSQIKQAIKKQKIMYG